MLKYLALKNLVLIESCEIEFGRGLNILSGETGAGKTALIEGIHLALGHRADSSIIRKGAEKASIEASFELSFSPALLKLLEEAGILAAIEEPLIIRREISHSGKNRAFINCQMVSLPFLQKIGKSLIDLVSQHSHQELRSSDAQRELLDLFADLKLDIDLFFQCSSQEKILKEKLNVLLDSSAAKQREMDICQFELDEILDVNVQMGEEERLFEEHNRSAGAQELTHKLELIHQGVADSSQCMLSVLARYKNTMQSILHLDARLKELTDLIQEASVSLHEFSRQLSSYLDQLENDPKRFDFLETRLSAIQKIKRKYGNSFEEILAYKTQLQEKLGRLENLDQELEECRKHLVSMEEKTLHFAKILTKKRREAALVLQKALTVSLQQLNMPSAVLNIEVKPQARSSSGEDAVNFWLAPNTGEPSLPVKDSSSGGELSRLMLAIKTTLAEKNQTPVIIFDEIDANVGGETASLIGEKLHELGKYRQILCITHFPQVASKADRHLLVRKQEVDGRTISFIKALDDLEKEKELLRMLGGKKIKL